MDASTGVDNPSHSETTTCVTEHSTEPKLG